jgi:hypothetical protein
MAITTLDGLIAAAKQRVVINKTATIASIAASGTSVFDRAGAPGAGTLAGTSTTTGVVPTDATAGCPLINAFGGGNTGYLARAEISCTVSARVSVYDLLWKAGAYAFNASTSGNSPASFSSRIPGGTDYTGLELWYEQVTVGTGVQNVAVTYNDENGSSSTTGTVAAPAAMAVNRMFQLPLAAGDKGIQGVTGVVGSVATVGTFNLLVLRPLAEARIRVANDAVIQDMLATGMPIVYADSALMIIVTPDSTSSGLVEVALDIVNG